LEKEDLGDSSQVRALKPLFPPIKGGKRYLRIGFQSIEILVVEI
jgi:hypothetical protein